MKRLFCLIVVVLVLFSCEKEKSGTLKVTGTIDGLKKGTLYLQKYVDTLLVRVDSALIKGEGSFILIDEITSPEIYYLTLDALNDEGIAFFAEKGEIHITSKLSKFSTSAVVTGSVNHQYLDEFNNIEQQFNGQELDFVKERFDAQKINDTATLSKIDLDEKNLLRRKVLFATNFVINHAAYEVAPYIALTELYYANSQLLDTIHKSLTPEVLKSKYGQEFERLMKGIAEEEND